MSHDRPVPPAATPPWPAHPAPIEKSAAPPPVEEEANPASRIDPRTIALAGIGAAAIGSAAIAAAMLYAGRGKKKG